MTAAARDAKPVVWQLLREDGTPADWIRLNPPTDATERWRPLYAALALYAAPAPVASAAPPTDDPIVDAQHDETGRMWTGPRSKIPRRFAECVGAAPPATDTDDNLWTKRLYRVADNHRMVGKDHAAIIEAAAALRSLLAQIEAQARELAELRADAARYRWLRERLECRYLENMAGTKRLGITTRVGRAYFDSPTTFGTAGEYDALASNKLDAAIDDALAGRHE